MSRPTQTAVERRKLLARLFPDGIPVLWCPMITHYDRGGGIDAQRMAAHLRHLSPHVKGFLIPGSTGDGWELSDSETRRLLETGIREMARLNLQLLVGTLKTEADAAIRAMRDTVDWLESSTGEGNIENRLARSHVCGFTVCPPRGKELTQQQIGAALGSILESGLPAALYQLPQITLNEMQPELVAALAKQFPNFILLKDTSGADHVALSGQKLENVFLVRGAEGDYARWLKVARGPYDGFLLSTANCFARQFHQILEDLAARRLKAAQEMSERLTACINEVFGIVTGLPHGNPFANANKAMDHFFAWGPKAQAAAPPRLHAGVCLHADVIRATGEALSRHGLMPDKGYWE
ncbi:MAG: dihydrodipicolinate synthase family protein [Verrucomicrobia bacterium]|nr:MAG: dihydrodipicolinate synthase family protein [Verrucomicrobiota bacterium]